MKYAITKFVGGREAIIKILPLSKVPGFDPKNPPPFAYAVPDGVGIGWEKHWINPPGFDPETGEMTDPGAFAWAPPSAEAPERQIARYAKAVQRRLDSFAKERGYDNILAACTYAASGVPSFRAEGQRCVSARDAAWAKFYEILNAAMEGGRPAPSLDRLLAGLPALEWPDELDGPERPEA